LAKAGVDLNLSFEDLKTALMVAISAYSFDAARLLIFLGADINRVAGDWMTALSVAAQSGNMYMLNILLTHGVDIKKTLACLTEGNLDQSVAQVVCKNLGKARIRLAMDAVNMLDMARVRNLLEDGVDINSCDRDGPTLFYGNGQTLLMCLAFPGSFDVK